MYKVHLEPSNDRYCLKESDMESPKGSICTESTHQVKTLKGAREWWLKAEESMLPVKITQHTSADGRIHLSIRDKNGTLVHRRG